MALRLIREDGSGLDIRNVNVVLAGLSPENAQVENMSKENSANSGVNIE